MENLKPVNHCKYKYTISNLDNWNSFHLLELPADTCSDVDYNCYWLN